MGQHLAQSRCSKTAESQESENEDREGKRRRDIAEDCLWWLAILLHSFSPQMCRED